MYLLSGQNFTGSGSAQLATYWSDMAYVLVESSGNSASASLMANVSDDTRTWMKVTSWAIGVNATATAQISSFFFKVRAQVDWVSGATNTGTVYFQYSQRKMFP